MKKVFLVSLVFLFAASFAADCPYSPSVEGPVSYYGKLKVREGFPFIDGIKEDRDTIKLVQLKGISFGWSNTGWESSYFYNANAVERLVKDWKPEVLRAAYGSTGVAISSVDAVSNLERVKTVIDAAIENDVYIIIDWHSHNAQNQVAQAKEFFTLMAQTYGKCNNVIFELYNEPVCSDGANSCGVAQRTTWNQIKTYAEEVIPEIRNYSDNLVLVGTPEWSQKIQDVVGNAINDINVGYVVHFYAASHPLSSFRNNIQSALGAGLPVFVTEYGTTHSDGGSVPNNYNTHNTARSDEWLEYLAGRKISHVAWNVNDKYEGSAFFGAIQNEKFDQTIAANWSDITKMTASGKYIFEKLNYYYECAPYNPSPAARCSATPVKPIALTGSFDFDFFGGASLNVNLQQSGNAVLEVFSLQGKKIGDAFNGYKNAGSFKASFASLNLKNGVFIFKLRQNGNSQTKILRIIK